MTTNRLTENKFYLAAALVLCLGQTACNSVEFGSSPAPVVQASAPAPSTQSLQPTVIASPSPTPSPTCVTLEQIQNPLRILFMLDKSGSTLTTDPNNNFRAQSIEAFVSTYSHKTNFTYAFGYFADSAQFDSYTGTNGSTRFGTAANLTASLNAFKTRTSSGGTMYGAAFDAISDLISDDQAAGNKQDYVVLFMSDGEPTDMGTGTAIRNNITSLVNNLKATVDQNNFSTMSLSSVYFGPASATSKGNLSLMATLGNGAFLDTNDMAATRIQIDKLIKDPTAINQCK